MSFYLSIHSSDRSVDMIYILSIHSFILLYTWFALTDYDFPFNFNSKLVLKNDPHGSGQSPVDFEGSHVGFQIITDFFVDRLH